MPTGDPICQHGRYSNVCNECHTKSKIEGYEKSFTNMLENCDFFKKQRDEAQAKLEAAEKELLDARSYVAEVALGGTHYQHDEGQPCVRCDRDALESSLKAAKEAIQTALNLMAQVRTSSPESFNSLSEAGHILNNSLSGQPLPEDRYRKVGSLGRCPLCRNVLVETVSGQNIKCVCCYNVWVLDKPICAIKKEGTPKGSSAIGGGPTLAPTGQQTGEKSRQEAFEEAREAGDLRGMLMNKAEFYCPKCNFSKDGTKFCGELFNPCDSGCCTTLACMECKTVYFLKEKCKPPCDCHYHWLIDPHIEEKEAPQGGGAESRKGDSDA